MRSTSLDVAKAGNLKLDFMAKASEFTFLGLKTFLDVIKIPNLKKPFGRMDTQSFNSPIALIFPPLENLLLSG